MFIHINGDDDIRDFIKNYITDDELWNYALNYVCRAPGYRCYMDLGEFNGELFLEMRVVRALCFQIEWNLTMDVFVDEIKKFGFKKDTLLEFKGLFLKYPQDFSVKEENLLLENLLNLTFNGKCYMKFKYGLK